jgi:hypothetical protein
LARMASRRVASSSGDPEGPASAIPITALVRSTWVETVTWASEISMENALIPVIRSPAKATTIGAAATTPADSAAEPDTPNPQCTTIATTPKTPTITYPIVTICIRRLRASVASTATSRSAGGAVVGGCRRPGRR